jgi:PAS domain S-box-containing protein
MTKSRMPSRETSHSKALLTSTAEAAFASDASGRITVWNEAAEALLGHEASRVVGKRCFEVIRGRDLFGNRFCNESCAVRKMRRHQEPIHPFRFLVATSAGDMQEVRCSVIVDSRRRGRDYTIIHLIQPVQHGDGSDGPGGSDRQRLSSPSSASDPGSVPTDPAHVLTEREVQVLRLLAGGTGPKEIAQVLGVASATVNNHIQHILGKLGVHNKLQAVFVARRDNLI